MTLRRHYDKGNEILKWARGLPISLLILCYLLAYQVKEIFDWAIVNVLHYSTFVPYNLSDKEEMVRTWIPVKNTVSKETDILPYITLTRYVHKVRTQSFCCVFCWLLLTKTARSVSLPSLLNLEQDDKIPPKTSSCLPTCDIRRRGGDVILHGVEYKVYLMFCHRKRLIHTFSLCGSTMEFGTPWHNM